MTSVMDYQTGSEVEGAASAELVAASEAAGHEGAVVAYLDARRGEWRPLDPSRAADYRRMGHDVRTVCVAAAAVAEYRVRYIEGTATGHMRGEHSLDCGSDSEAVEAARDAVELGEGYDDGGNWQEPETITAYVERLDAGEWMVIEVIRVRVGADD